MIADTRSEQLELEGFGIDTRIEFVNISSDAKRLEALLATKSEQEAKDALGMDSDQYKAARHFFSREKDLIKAITSEVPLDTFIE